MNYWEKQWEGERGQAWEYGPDGFEPDVDDEEEEEDGEI